MTILVLEIPHRYPPKCWAARDIADACRLAGVETEAPTEDALVEHLGGDNHAALVFSRAEDVIRRLNNWGVEHQAASAKQRLREEAERIGWAV